MRREGLALIKTFHHFVIEARPVSTLPDVTACKHQLPGNNRVFKTRLMQGPNVRRGERLSLYSDVPFPSRVALMLLFVSFQDLKFVRRVVSAMLSRTFLEAHACRTGLLRCRCGKAKATERVCSKSVEFRGFNYRIHIVVLSLY